MEPRSAERGNLRADVTDLRTVGGASMEPRSAERGNQDYRFSSRLPPGVASMEPRSAERGNSDSILNLQPRVGGFNGATLSRTWKLRRRSDGARFGF